MPVKKGDVWEVAEPGRPPRMWEVVGTEVRGSFTCLKIVGQQRIRRLGPAARTPTAWRRRDVVWMVPQYGVAYRVERTIERREPARREPTHRSLAQYELDSPFKYTGRLFEDAARRSPRPRSFRKTRRRSFSQPAALQGEIEVLARIGQYLETQNPTPYRKALVQLQNQLEQARRGEIPPELGGDDTPAAPIALALGQRVPDFVVTCLTAKESVRSTACLAGRTSRSFTIQARKPAARF